MVNNSFNFKVLDCTLRDGGYVNNFNFGKENIFKITNGLSLSKIDLIELGFLVDTERNENQSLYNYIDEAEKIIPRDCFNDFCVMIRPDKYDISKLKKCDGKIKFIRFAFHYKDLDVLLYQAKIVKDLGYKIFFNPVNVLSYSHTELENLLSVLNDIKPAGVYIVDTFGSMLPSDLDDITPIFNEKLDNDIAIGLHLHENLSLSLACAIKFIDIIDNSRLAYIDSSILGMGRIPGNLCTELLLTYLNSKHGTDYNLEHIHSLISHPISKIKQTIPWGYMPAYSMTAIRKIDRTYAEYLLNKTDLTLVDINTILSDIVVHENSRNFNEQLVSSLYNNFIASKRDTI